MRLNERDFADQGPLTEMHVEENAEMFTLMLRHNSHPTIPYRFKDDLRIGHASAGGVYWTRLAAGPGQLQQAPLGVHLDVAVRPGPPPDASGG